MRTRTIFLTLSLVLTACSSTSEGGEGQARIQSPDAEHSEHDAALDAEAHQGDIGAEKEVVEPLTCVVSGCNGSVCGPEAVDTPCVEGPPSEMCLSEALCGVLEDGSCGWTLTEAYTECLAQYESDATRAEESDADVESSADAVVDTSEEGPIEDSLEDDTEDLVEDTQSAEDSSAQGDEDAGALKDAQADIGDDAAALSDAENDKDAGAPGDADTTDADQGDVEPGPETLVGEVVPITEESQYDKGELYGMGVDPEGRVSIFWRAERTDGLHDLVLSQSDPAVSGFQAPITLVEGIAPLGITAGGDLEMDGASHLFTWRDDPEAGVSRVMFRRAAMPALEGEDVILGESSLHTLYRPHIAWRAPSTLCVLWQKSGNNDSSDVVMRCSSDGGVSFAPEVGVNPLADTASVSDAVFGFSSKLFVAYHAKPSTSSKVRIYVRSSEDLGATWTEPLDMSTLGGAEDGFHPTLARGMDGVLHLAWYNSLPGLEGQAWLSHSNEGMTWSTPELMPTIQSQIALCPGRGAVLHASGEDAKLGYGCIANPPPNCGIQVMSSYDSGANWGEASPLPVSAETTLLGHDMVSNLIEGYLHIAWWETLPNQMTKMQLKFITLEE